MSLSLNLCRRGKIWFEMRESCEMFNHDDFASRLFGFPQQYRSQHLGSNMLTKGLLGFYF